MYFCNRSYAPPGCKPKTTVKINHYVLKAMQCFFCVVSQLSKPVEKVDGSRCQRQLSIWSAIYTEKAQNVQIGVTKWFFSMIMSHRTISTEELADLAPFDYHLLESICHALSEQRFNSQEEAIICHDDWCSNFHKAASMAFIFKIEFEIIFYW